MKFKHLFSLAALSLMAAATLTSCEDILGHWEKPTSITPTPSEPEDKSVPGLLAGKFTINGSGDQVQFSQGNLQYQASTKTWRFAENQYDYVGDAVGNTTPTGRDTQSDWIDLFGWGTAGHSFASGYGTFYQPWETDKTDGTKYGPSGTSNGLYGTYAQGDWGTNMGAGWRTLTNAEWTYLFNTRTVNGGTGNGKSYTLGQSVNGKLGIVIYPDDYTGATYSGSDWSTFESAGCVFLPAAGRREGTSVSNAGSNGNYWSSSPDGSNAVGAYFMRFNSVTLIPANLDYRYDGFSVRLVRPVE